MRAAEWCGGRVPVEDQNDARTKLVDFFSILLYEQRRFRSCRKGDDRRQSHHLINLLFNVGTIYSHIFQAGTAGD